LLTLNNLPSQWFAFDELLHQVELLILLKMGKQGWNLVMVAELIQYPGFSVEQASGCLQAFWLVCFGKEAFDYAAGAIWQVQVLCQKRLPKAANTELANELVTFTHNSGGTVLLKLMRHCLVKRLQVHQAAG